MTITVESLGGYVATGLDADLRRWCADEPMADAGTDIRPVEPFLARLPEQAAASLAEFDRRVRSGTLPQFLDVYDWSYGFDFAGNDCGILDSDYETELTDDDLYSIAADGGGNLFVVLTNGQVATWFHEEEVVEAGTRFDTVDVFVWSMVRVHAVREKKLALADVEPEFRALGQDGMLAPGVGLLNYLG